MSQVGLFLRSAMVHNSGFAGCLGTAKDFLATFLHMVYGLRNFWCDALLASPGMVLVIHIAAPCRALGIQTMRGPPGQTAVNPGELRFGRRIFVIASALYADNF